MTLGTQSPNEARRLAGHWRDYRTRLEEQARLAAEMDLAGVEIELARSDDHLTRLRGILQGLKPNDLFEYCILDTPPSLGVLMTSALAAADVEARFDDGGW